MSDAQQNELLPCPFCGSVRLVPDTVSNTGGNIHFTRCVKCQAHGPWFDRGLRQTNPWNKRAERSVSEDTARLDWLDSVVGIHLHTHQPNGDFLHEICRDGHCISEHPDLRKAIDEAMARDDVDRREQQQDLGERRGQP